MYNSALTIININLYYIRSVLNNIKKDIQIKTIIDNKKPIPITHITFKYLISRDQLT